MIDVDGNYKEIIEEHNNKFWDGDKLTQKCNMVTHKNNGGISFYKNEVNRLVSEGGEKNLLKAKRYINLLLQMDYEK